MELKDKITEIMQKKDNEEIMSKLKELTSEIIQFLNEEFDVWIGSISDDECVLPVSSYSQINEIEEKLGISIDLLCSILDTKYIFEDEYLICDKCSHYKEISSTVVFDGYSVCYDCLEEFFDEYVDEFINNKDKAIPYTVNIEEKLKELGFTKYDKEYVSDMHTFKIDDPEEILKALNDKYDVIFNIKSCNPFEICFEAYIKDKED